MDRRRRHRRLDCGKVVPGDEGYGVLGAIIAGIVGAIVGGWLFAC